MYKKLLALILLINLVQIPVFADSIGNNINEKENVEIANILKGIVSEQTALSYLTMVEDVNDELERIESERSAYDIPFTDLGDEEDEV